MKRTNLVLDPSLLAEARRLLGTRTYSETVNKALEEAIRFCKIRMIPDLLTKVKWEGDLAEMRDDRPRKRVRRKPAA
jgi:Arc/MetJ family transcription regulator